MYYVKITKVVFQTNKHRSRFNKQVCRSLFSLIFILIFLILSVQLFANENLNRISQNRQEQGYELNQNKNVAKDTSIDKGEEILTASSEEKQFSFAGFPVILYTPETSVIFGGGSAITIRKQSGKDGNRPNNVNLYAIYTLKNQVILNIQPDFYFDDENWELKVLLYYQKYPDTFYGIGNRTSKNNAEDITTEDFLIQPWLMRRIYKKFRIGLFYDLTKTSVLEIEKDGILSQGTFKGISGSFLTGMGTVIDWDTRNNTFYPSKGSWLQFYCTFYRSWMGSDFEYESYTYDFRHYFSFSNAHILAVQLFGTSLNGEITFNKFARLNKLRGIHESRFRDRKMAFAQIEYRYPIYKRISGVAFSAIGDVMNNVSDFDVKDLKYTAGLGLRFALIPAEGINLRFDVGFSRYGINPYFQLSEAF